MAEQSAYDLDGLRMRVAPVVDFSDREWDLVKAVFSLITAPARTLLTSIGNTERKLYFLQQGIARLYCIDAKGDAATIFIFKEGHFASCYDSFLSRLASDQALETLEDCLLLAIDRESFERLHVELPKMHVLTRHLADQRFINAQRIFTSHIMYSPEQRYLAFERVHGDLLLRVPHQIIASFLGMTPVSMSRIRRRVLKK